MTELEKLLLEQLEKVSKEQQQQIMKLMKHFEKVSETQQQQIQVLTNQVSVLTKEWKQREEQTLKFLTSSAELELLLARLEQQQSKR